MVKKKVGGGQRFRRAAAAVAAAAADGSGGAGGEGQGGALPPRRLQQKVTRKVKFLERVAASKQAALAASTRGVAKKSKRKGKALPNLDSLAGALDEVAAAAAKQAGGKAKLQADRGRGSSVKRLKARRAIALSETHRLQAVREHPAYKADPLAAIAHHLQATLPPPLKPAGGAGKQQQQKGRKKGAKKKKQEQGQGQAGMQTD